MGGGVNPIEWVLPPVALAHMSMDQVARKAAPLIGGKASDIPGAPGSPAAAAAAKAKDDAEAARITALDSMNADAKNASDLLAARTETPQEALDAKRRAEISAEKLGGGKRRASQTLTDPGMTLSGSYA